MSLCFLEGGDRHGRDDRRTRTYTVMQTRSGYDVAATYRPWAPGNLAPVGG